MYVDCDKLCTYKLSVFKILVESGNVMVIQVLLETVTYFLMSVYLNMHKLM